MYIHTYTLAITAVNSYNSYNSYETEVSSPEDNPTRLLAAQRQTNANNNNSRNTTDHNR